MLLSLIQIDPQEGFLIESKLGEIFFFFTAKIGTYAQYPVYTQSNAHMTVSGTHICNLYFLEAEVSVTCIWASVVPRPDR